MFLYGKNAVLERLQANPASVRKIFLKEGEQSDRVMSLIKEKDIAFEWVPEKQFMKLKKADRVQGVIALVDKFSYCPFNELLEKALKKNESIVFLDRLNDPQNLGVIIRSLACFGGFSLVIPEHESCEVTDTVLHVASGGENYVAISKVGNLSNALIKAKEKGFWIAGTVIEGGQDLAKSDLPFPLCLVMGSEGHGIRHGVKKQLDLQITLPMQGAGLSFNVAVATSIFCYEITRQRRIGNG
jgi:23S rRNA (guanosine2251-2'-O)-methyltransferase